MAYIDLFSVSQNSHFSFRIMYNVYILMIYYIHVYLPFCLQCKMARTKLQLVAKMFVCACKFLHVVTCT
jgi:hypothetical protein